MTTQAIVESGMTFGPYPEGQCFYIEKSKLYQKLQKGVQMAEFLLLQLRDNQIPSVWIIEAKSSTPQPGNQQHFDEFIGEIREKLVNGLSLGIAACLRRHPDAESELSALFTSIDLANSEFRLILVVNGHKNEWLPPLQEALVKALHPTVKTWGLSATSVTVLNEVLAKEYGLIV